MRSETCRKLQAPITRTLIATAVSACFVPLVFALPLGPGVVNGSASFVQNGNTLTVTNSNQAIINWQSFSIGNKEITRFVQPSANSSVLNRVLGNDPSQLLGALQSNGRVFLINPAGVLVGQGARVDVAGFAASTLNLSNSDFLANRLRFGETPGAGKVQNLGAITTPSGGNVYLVAAQVDNGGIISAPNGEVLLAAGQRVELIDTATPGVRVAVVGSAGNATNLGTITAEAGRIGIAGVLVKNSGTLNASSVVSEGGRIFLKASGDTLLSGDSRISATGAKGGDVEVLGQRVALTDDTRIDASGRNGGGSVLVGGDYQGKNVALQNARITYFGKDASIQADALENGDGGKVIVWADDTTRAYGSISARGGARSGNGGFVETSGKRHLDFSARVDTTAPKGKAGTILLDPQDITIADGGGGADDAMLANNILDAADANSTTDVIVSETALEALSGNVTLQASRDIVLSDLTDDLLNMAGVGLGSTLTLSAGRHITATADVNDRFQTGGGAVSFTTSGGDINIGGVKSLGGNVTMNASGTATIREIVTTPAAGNGGDIQLTSGGLMSLGGGHLDARKFAGNDGNVTLSSGGAIIMQTAKTIYANQLKMSAIGGITDGAAGGISTQVVSLNNITNSGSGDIKISNTGSLSIIDQGATLGYGVRQQASGAGISITTSATSSLGIDAPVIATGGPVLLSGAGGVTFVAYNAGPPATGGGVLSGGGAVTVSASDANASISMPAGSLISSDNGAVSLKANNMSFTGSSINAGNGAVSLNVYDGTLAISVGNGATDVPSTSLGLTDTELKTVTTSGMLTIGASANAGAMTLAGTLDLTSGSGLTGALSLDAGTSGFSIGNPIHTAYGLNIASGGTLTNSVAITAGGDVGLKADKMALAGGTLDAGSNAVTLKPYTPVPIQLGVADDTNSTANTLELSNAELGSITAARLRIGDASSGAITVKSALANANAGDALKNISTSLQLTSGGAITQDAGATIAAMPGLSLTGASVTMGQANPVGVIAGATSGGDFIYRTASLLTVSEVDGVSGITVAANGNVKLESDAVSGINQQAGKVISMSGGTGGLALKTIGPVYLPEANDVKNVAADLASNSGTGSFFLRSSNDLTVGSLFSINGVSTTNTNILLAAGTGKTLTISAANPISAGAAGSASLEADLLVLDDTVTAGIVDIRPFTANRTITVGSASCNVASCLNVINLWKVVAQTIGIGSDSAGKESGAIYVDGITTGNALITDKLATTTRIGLLSGAGITQNGAINVQDLGISAGGTVNLGSANSISRLAGKTSAGNFTFANSAGFEVTSMSGGTAPHTYAMSGISTGGGNVSLTTSTGDITLSQPINAGSGAVSLTTGGGSIQDNGGTSVNDVIAGSLTVSATGTNSFDAWGIAPTVSSGTNSIRTIDPAVTAANAAAAAEAQAQAEAAAAAEAKALADAKAAAEAKALADAKAAAEAQALADAKAAAEAKALADAKAAAEAQALADAQAAAEAKALADAQAAAKALAEAEALKAKEEAAVLTRVAEETVAKAAVVEAVVGAQTRTAAAMTPPPIVPLRTETSGGSGTLLAGRSIGGGDGEFGAASLDSRPIPAAPFASTASFSGQPAAGGLEIEIQPSESRPATSADGNAASKPASDKANQKSEKEATDDAKVAKKKPAQCT